jgi:glycosyltransferase involved in cell wall biosynthesis
LREQGVERFFVRISQGTALVLNVLRPFLGIEILYWNSGAVREAWPDWEEDRGTRLRLWIQDLMTRFNVKCSTRLVTGPERMVDYYVRNYRVARERCVVVYNDIDTTRFSPATSDRREVLRQRWGFAPDRKVALFVGRLSRYKGGANLEPILDALEQGPVAERLQVMIAGEAHLPGIGERLAQRRNAQVLGPVPNHALPDLYRSVDMFLLPSNAEGFPRVVLEAMATGLPVVAFDVGGVRDILGARQQDLVIPARRNDDFARAIERLLADPALMEHLGRENLARVKAYETPLVADMFVERIARAGF